MKVVLLLLEGGDGTYKVFGHTREREDEEEKEEDKIVCARHIDTKCNK
jgi:hypothetical protein